MRRKKHIVLLLFIAVFLYGCSRRPSEKEAARAFESANSYLRVASIEKVEDEVAVRGFEFSFYDIRSGKKSEKSGYIQYFVDEQKWQFSFSQEDLLDE